MARFYGPIGFAKEIAEIAPGVWDEEDTEVRYYKGDVEKDYTNLNSGSSINDDVSITTVISIVADRYALEHFTEIDYVKWMGVKWKVKSIEPQFPRLKLTLGGVYHGEA